MRAVGLGLLAALALLAACKKEVPSSSVGERFAEVGEGAAGADSKKEAIKVALPQIAYTYRYGFELPADEIPAVQQRHIAACDKLGMLRCHVLNMESGARDGSSIGASLKLVVDARIARSFGASLAKAVSDRGGKQSDNSIEAEDLSKQIVDVEARLRAKQVLAERLMSLLRTRQGPVKDLVEAERHVAEVQEEIDAAQSWLAEARGRVDMSTFEISYQPESTIGGGFLKPLKASLGTMGGFLGQSMNMLITLLAVLLPWALLGTAILFGVRWVRQRFTKPEED